jgi:hypothetical protein
MNKKGSSQIDTGYVSCSNSYIKKTGKKQKGEEE